LENFILNLLQAANEATTQQQLADAMKQIDWEIIKLYAFILVGILAYGGMMLHQHIATDKLRKQIKTLKTLTSECALAGTKERIEALEEFAAAEIADRPATR